MVPIQNELLPQNFSSLVTWLAGCATFRVITIQLLV